MSTSDDRAFHLLPTVIERCRHRRGDLKLADSTGARLTGGETLIRALVLRRVLRRHSLAEDERLELLPGETKRMETIRFRTLGCFPLTGAIRSTATTLDEIIDELETATVSERQGRAIDRDQSGSMEKKKREGYF